jgi:multidrug efflux system outer membrane protein
MRAPTAIFLAALAVLSGCALKTPLTQSEVVEQALPATTQIPSAWQAEARAGPVADGWLKSFQDPLLEAIVAEAIANNLDLRLAAERVRIAQQQVLVVGAQLAPQIGGQLGAKSIRDKDQDDRFNSTLAYVGVAWELDLWGRLRAQRAATEAVFEASALDYAQARQSLAALVAKTWYLAIETRQLVELGEQTVQVFGELLKLVEIRRSAGKDSDLDVVDTRAKLDTAQGDLEGSRQAAGEVRRALEGPARPLSGCRTGSGVVVSTAAASRRCRGADLTARTPPGHRCCRARRTRRVPPAGSRTTCAAA